jgi:DNA-binding MarR family transcriptional regulator
MLAGADHPVIALIDEIARTQGRLAAATALLGNEEQLSGAQLTVLTAVVQASSPPTVPQIGRSLGHTRQAIQRTADALSQLGLIEYAANPDHKRAHHLVPTDEGRAVFLRIEQRSRNWLDRVTDPEDITAAATTLQALRLRLETDNASWPQTNDANSRQR